MIPSRRWFPQSLRDRAAWYDNFNFQIQPIGSNLGLTPAELAEIDADNQAIQFLANTAVRLSAYEAAVRRYRIIITEGDKSDLTPAFPGEPSLLPPVGIRIGMFERLVSVYRVKIMASTSYTQQLGDLLGIDPLAESTGRRPIQELKPTIKPSESFGAYEFNVDVLRLGMPAFKVQIQRLGASMWLDAAFSTDNPCPVNVAPTAPGQPERILVRAQLMKNNGTVGIPSDPIYVTIYP